MHDPIKFTTDKVGPLKDKFVASVYADGQYITIKTELANDSSKGVAYTWDLF